MVSIYNRSFSGETDLQGMISLLQINRPPGWLADYPGRTDLQELLALPEVIASTRLWFVTGSEPAGFAMVDPWHNLLFEIRPGPENEQITAQVMAWGASRLRVSLSAGEPAVLGASCRSEDDRRIALLKRFGLERQPGETLHLERDLSLSLPFPQLPQGFTIRPAAGESEVGALVSLHRAAFQTDQMTIEYRLAMMRTPEYEPTLDLVVAAPDGSLAAYLMCHFSQEENNRTGQWVGFTDPVAVHPACQGKGLAKALLLVGMHLLKRHGMQRSALSTSRENVAMQKAAEAVGFKIVSTRSWFSKKV
jgi:ribosomal protein S18 acetylase RimI-like enzyme